MEAEVAELKKQVAALTKELTRVSGKNTLSGHDSRDRRKPSIRRRRLCIDLADCVIQTRPRFARLTSSMGTI